MITYIDLFAGCGGLSDGFESTQKYKGLAHIEWEKAPSETLIKRLKSKWGVNDSDKKVLVFDIQKTNDLLHGWNNSQYKSSIGLLKTISPITKLDILIGGPPCQAYSIAGRVRDTNGMHDDYRNFLFESYIKIMEALNPDIFVFENVPGILSAMPGGIPIIKRIKDSFDNAGYVTLDNFEDALFDLSNFGVPQKRSRVIIIGLRKQSFSKIGNLQATLKSFYTQLRLEATEESKKTAQEALKGLDKFYPNPPSSEKTKFSHYPITSSHYNHYPRFHNNRDIEIFRLLSEDLHSENRKYSSAEALKKLYTERTGKISQVHKYNVINPNQPSNTIPAHLYKDGLRHIHWDPEQARSITVREAARLQTFDDDFEFLGSMGDQFKMIGNAVPPLFARKLALSLTKLIKLRD